MKQNGLLKMILSLRFIIGFLLFLPSYLIIRALTNNYNVFVERALYETRVGAIAIILSLFLIYPIFNKVSKILFMNYIRFLIGIILIIRTSISLVNILQWGASLSNLNFRELYLINIDFAAFSTLFVTRILIGILLIKPFINLKERKLNFKYREAIIINKYSRKVDEFFYKLTIKISKAINNFLDRGVETSKHNNIGLKNSNKQEVIVGKNTVEAKSNNLDEIIRASKLLESGVITVEEFNDLKKDILYSNK